MFCIFFPTLVSVLFFFSFLFFPFVNEVVLITAVLMDGEGDGTPLQYSCLENPMDGGAW